MFIFFFTLRCYFSLCRLALAETFCLNCGILALDEPTTKSVPTSNYLKKIQIFNLFIDLFIACALTLLLEPLSLPSFLPSFLSSFLPFFLPSYLLFFLYSFLPCLLPSYLLFFLFSFLPIFFSSFIPSFLACFLPIFFSSFLPSILLHSLDEANKAGLAHALSRIILNRQRQHNFQLICITHDEDFVRLISTELARYGHFLSPEVVRTGYK